VTWQELRQTTGREGGCGHAGPPARWGIGHPGQRVSARIVYGHRERTPMRPVIVPSSRRSTVDNATGYSCRAGLLYWLDSDGASPRAGNRVEQSRAVVSLARWALGFYTAPMALDGPAGLTRNCWWAWLKSRSSPGAGAGASPSWSECLGSTTLMASGRVWTMTRTLHPDE
jgi:hypothetical protein